MSDREGDTIDTRDTNLHYMEALDMSTWNKEAGLKKEGQKHDAERKRKGGHRDGRKRDGGAIKCRRSLGYQKMKTGTDGSVQIEKSSGGGMEIIKKEEEINKGKRLSAVRQVLKPPAHPTLPSLLKSHPLPSLPLLG